MSSMLQHKSPDSMNPKSADPPTSPSGQSEEQFRRIANASPVMVWISDAEKVCYFFSKGWLDFTGTTPDQEYGSGWLKSVHPDDRDQCVTIFDEAFDQRTAFKRQYRLLRSDGNYCWILDHGVPQYTVAGSFSGYLGSCVEMEDGEISGQAMKQAGDEQLALASAVQELKRSNEALEEFAFVASHDMKEPLRKILVYNEFILTHADDMEKYAGKIRDAALRMDKLIDDLLNLSRIRSLDSYFEWTDLNTIVADVKNDLELIIAEKHAIIKSESLPVVFAVSEQLRQMIYNLIVNALKYSKPGIPPVITMTWFEVTAEKFPGKGLIPGIRYVEMIVTDNGLGFEQENAEKIFTLFHRLHAQNEIAGSGMGLALCEKVAKNHHGLIFAESRVNEGSSFHIVLPEDQKTLHFSH